MHPSNPRFRRGAAAIRAALGIAAVIVTAAAPAEATPPCGRGWRKGEACGGAVLVAPRPVPIAARPAYFVPRPAHVARHPLVIATPPPVLVAPPQLVFLLPAPVLLVPPRPGIGLLVEIPPR